MDQTKDTNHDTSDIKPDSSDIKPDSSDIKTDSSGTNSLIQLTRSVYTLDDYNKTYAIPTKPTRPLSGRIKDGCHPRSVAKTMTSYLPILKTIRKYRPKEYITGDILAGLTASFLHIPQGLAFGLLSSLRPIYGLYTSFFPVLFYLIFGTSPHVSFGTNAIMALLTQTVVEREADVFTAGYTAATNTSTNLTQTGPSEAELLHVKVGTAMALSLLAGILMAVMGILKLGFLTSFLSVSFFGGFTTAAAVHIASSQVTKMFGIKTKSFSGAGKLILMYIDMFRKIESTNLSDILIAVVSFATLLAVKVGINERYKEKMKIPIPIDFIIVIIASLVSYLAHFKEDLDVTIVGTIPSGFEAPLTPRLGRASNFISDAIVMGVLSFALTIALAKIMAKKHGCKIDDSQELVAYGACNIFSSFFGCFPSATAPPRTMILSSLGVKTTLNGVPTVIVCLLVILVLGPLFETLPVAVLAAMITVSIKDLLLQYRNLPNIWRINKYDFVIWVCTNTAGVLIDLDYGLFVGVGVSILLVVVQNQLTSGYLMNVASSEDVLYRTARQKQNIPKSVAIFRFPVSLYFATAERFKGQIFKEVFNPQLYLKKLKTLEKTKLRKMESFANKAFDDEGVDNGRPNGTGEPNHQFEVGVMTKPKTIIIDCSMIQYMDMAGSNVLQEVTQQFIKQEINVFLTGITTKAQHVMTNSGFFKKFPKSNVYLDVFDAVDVSSNERAFVFHL